MATQHPISFPDLKIDQWIGAWNYVGTRETIIAAGVLPADPALFPGAPGCSRKRKLTRMYEGRRVVIQKTGDTYWVTVRMREEEMARMQDPGPDRVKQHAQDMGALKIHDIVWVTRPDDSNDGYEYAVEVMSGFELFRVTDRDGPHFDEKSGKRFSYKWGYQVRQLGGRCAFMHAHALRDEDGGPAYLRLVHDVSAP